MSAYSTEENYVPEIIASVYRLFSRKSILSSTDTYVRGRKEPQLFESWTCEEISKIETYGSTIDDIIQIKNDCPPKEVYIRPGPDIPSVGHKTNFLVTVVIVVVIVCLCLLTYLVIDLVRLQVQIDLRRSKPGKPDGTNDTNETGKPNGINYTNATGTPGKPGGINNTNTTGKPDVTGGGNDNDLTCIANDNDWCESQYCTQGFELRGDYCYQFISDLKPFHEAQSWCLINGATMAEPRNVRENEEITYFAREKSNNLYKKDNIWIGVTDLRHEGTFEYLSGSGIVTYTNWLGMANNKHDLDCVQLIIIDYDDVKKWVTSVCYPVEGLASVCQQDPLGYSGCCSVTDQSCIPTSCAPSQISKPRQMALFENIYVVCDTETDGGNWVIIQRRASQEVSFEQLWNEYANGFGNLCPTGNFWLGLNKVEQLCGSAQDHCEIRFDMEFEGKPSTNAVHKRGDNKYYANYDTFYISNQTDNYRITIGGYSGTAGDSLADSRLSETNINNVMFSTSDKDNSNCVNIQGDSGWWNNLCGMTNLNGLWDTGSPRKGVIWYTLTPWNTSLSFSEIKIRRH